MASSYEARNWNRVWFLLWNPRLFLPGIGPVGIENSWAVTTDGLEKLTLCKEEIIEL